MKRLLTLLFAASSLTAVGQVPDYLVPSNPVMYFDFDGNAIEGVNGDEPLLSSGDIAYVESAERHVLELNGSGAHLYHPDLNFPSFQTVSMCIEVRLDEFGSGFGADLVPILSKWESTGTQNNEWTVYETEGQIWLWWTDSFNPGSAISFTHNWTAGEWHTICFEVGARAALWIDGAFVEEKIRDEFGSSNRLFRLGDWNNFQNPSYRTFNGAIDRLAIWSSLLTDNTSEAFHLGEVAVPGCTNPEACNYDNEANQEDGSCVACDVATAFCGEGTAWDPETQTCIVANPADINLDGCVQLNDLLDLLSAYGDCGAEESPWQCDDPLGYQGYDYETVQIGEQCWFAENARFLPAVSPPEIGSDNDGAAHAYVYGYSGSDLMEAQSLESYQAYGALYNFNALESWQICPDAWHVPTDQDFLSLESYLGISEVQLLEFGWRGENEGNTLKAKMSDTPPFNGTDDFGFHGLGGSGREIVGNDANGSFLTNPYGLNQDGIWWTASPIEGGKAIRRSLFELEGGIARSQAPTDSGYSIRCIKDSE